MDRGDVLVFKTDAEKYANWKYFRAINTVTKENRTEEDAERKTGAKMYIVGNVFTKDKKVVKAQELFIGDFFRLTQEGEAHVADEADAALIFLTNKDF